MASNIDPSKINANYPVAGQNNSSQGFRNNFANIKLGLSQAKAEITELQSKSLLKTAIDGEPLNNNLAWATIFRAQLKSFSETYYDHGSVSGVIAIDFLQGTVQKLSLTGTAVFGFGNFPPMGQMGKILLWVSVPNTSFQIILPESVVYGIDIPQIVNRQVQFNRVGEYLLEFATTDGGSTYWLVRYFGSDMNASGATGATGVPGATGFTGSKGEVGPPGQFGGVSVYYLFKNTTANVDPGAGRLAFNNLNLSLATELYISDIDNLGQDIQSYLRTIDDSNNPVKGHFRIGNKVDASDYSIFVITTLQELTGYFKITCTLVGGSTAYTNNEEIVITFARNGDIGPIGYTGSAGFTGSRGNLGFTGSVGDIGYTGSIGPLGPQGPVGPVGAQGVAGELGYTGSIGALGYTGSKGDSGDPGGPQGPIGYTGSQGASGVPGEFAGVGATGATGLRGLTGAIGATGIGATGATGATGETGFTGSLGYTGSQGDLGYTGSASIEPGYTGSQGIGFTGSKGDVGFAGSVGGTGFTGSLGFTGSKGDVGFAGSIGGVGFTGSLGFTGSKGDVGFVGSASTVRGYSGSVGFAGSKGDVGFVGSASTVRGYAGSVGFAGSRGNTGFVGSASNVEGFTGSRGLVGSKGDVGFTGSIGGVGFTGSVGLVGSKGDKGFTGSKGDLGFTGSMGSTGTGFTGSKGQDGGPGTLIDTVYNVGNVSGTLVLDRNNGSVQKATAVGNITINSVSNMSTGQSITIILTQDGTGGRTLSSSFKFASAYKTLSTAGGAIDMLNIFYDGTTYYCTLTTGYA